jgi:hypothetical protein
MSSYSKFWASSSKITGFLKGRSEDQVTGNMLVVIRGTHKGLGTQGCLGRSRRRICFGKSSYKGDKERQEWAAEDL